MKLFNFGFPSSVNNRDARRLARLRRLLDEIGKDIANERAELKRLYEAATADAAFAFQAIENGESPEQISDEVEMATAAIIRHSKRISLLKEQVDFIEAMRQKLALMPMQKDDRVGSRSQTVHRHLAI